MLMALSASSSARQLLHVLQPLTGLNPHEAESLRTDALRQARLVRADDFPALAEFAQNLIESFLSTAWKRMEKELLDDFSRHLRPALKQLSAAGGVVRSDEDAERAPPHSVALAVPQSLSAVEWFRLLETAQVPERLGNSVDAVVRRNQTAPTVMAVMFEVLLEADSAQAFAWMNDFLVEHRGRLDQDVVRDLLRAWRRPRTLPREIRNWLFEWCGSEDLRQQWPAVAEETDAVLRRQLLEFWLPSLRDSRSSWLRRLAKIAEKPQRTEAELLDWLQRAIGELGEAANAFIGFSRLLGGEKKGRSEMVGTDPGWSGEAIFHELKRMESLFAPIILFADVLLAAPDGAYQLALALLGFPGPELAAWRQKLLRHTTGMVRQAVLDDLKADRQPIETIRTYSVGDRQLYRYLISQLDLVSRTFGSLRQRDKVVEQLALHFASLREAQLLPRELTARYRKLVLTLHEDSLRRLLDQERFEKTGDFVVRRDLLTAAAAARRYVQRRRALHTSVEEMIGSRYDFEKSVRQRRLQFARNLLHFEPRRFA